MISKVSKYMKCVENYVASRPEGLPSDQLAALVAEHNAVVATMTAEILIWNEAYADYYEDILEENSK